MSIEFRNVIYTYFPQSPYEQEALKGINLNLEKNKFIGIIGHTGSGKSTLIQHINALLLPSSGEVVVENFTMTNKSKNKSVRELRHLAGLVFQFPEYQLFEETIYKDIAFGPKNFGAKDEELKPLINEIIKLVGLDESYLERSPFEISGGQKRRVAIAGILAMKPEILVLDEPSAGLDPQGANEMMELFSSLHKAGKTIILVSHDMDYVLKYCDEVVVMKDGQIRAQKTPYELFSNADLLREVGIEAPKCLLFAQKLRNNGMKIDCKKIRDIESLSATIVDIKKRGEKI